MTRAAGSLNSGREGLSANSVRVRFPDAKAASNGLLPFLSSGPIFLYILLRITLRRDNPFDAETSNGPSRR